MGCGPGACVRPDNFGLLPRRRHKVPAPEWMERFLERLGLEPAAKRAWGVLCRAGCQLPPALLLWRYATTRPFAAERTESVASMVRTAEPAARARRVAEKRTGDRRERMFAERSRKASNALDATLWLGRHNPPVETFGDARAAYPVLSKIPLEQTASVLTKGGGRRREADPELFWLLLLQRCARDAGVRLGYTRIQALAACASTVNVPDVRTLHEFFSNQDQQLAADEIQRLVRSLRPEP